jgi:DMSO/TMAO reductase YedYZ heme-binding membrane subunit
MDEQSPQIKKQNWQDIAFQWSARNKPSFIFITNILYISLIAIVLATFYSINNDQEMYGFFAEKRAWFGRSALLLLLIVITPGILGRFNIQIKISRIITLYRRRLGILVFLIAFTHFHLIFLPKVSGTEPIMLQTFQVMGLTALVILSLLFLTSNNFSQRKLGKWWKRIHRLVYVVVLLILIHTFMQRVSIWSVLAGIFFILEITSLAYAFIKGKSFDEPVLKQISKD